MRLIDADAFKEYLRKGTEANADIIPQRLVDAVLDIIDGIMLDIDEQPTVDATPRWIPCEERMPERDGEYLCCYGKHIHIGQMIDGHFRHYGECADHLITAWMTLPEPYEGERRDDE